jgi:hypothetical protein
MATADERQRVSAGFRELLARLRAREPQAGQRADQEGRLALQHAANERAMAKHGRPLAHWYDRWEREQEAHAERLAESRRAA